MMLPEIFTPAPVLSVLILFVPCVSGRPLNKHLQCAIQSVNFYNFTYYSGSWMRNITLHEGTFRRKDPIGKTLFTESRLTRLEYADLTGGGHRQAVITIRTRPNGSMPVAVDYFVFECRNGRLRQLFHHW